jgi:uroporphyrinogen-III synthase
MSAALGGRGIVITRPRQQSAALAAMIAEAGGRALLFPVIEIRDTDRLAELDAAIGRLHEFDIAVFISPNAAERALRRIGARRWPRGLAAAAIGPGGAAALAAQGVTGVTVPARRFDSEGLLGTPLLQSAAGKRVVIFRGNGGRELLAEALRARGAAVEVVECYRRERPQADARPLLAAWARGEVDAVTVTSSEGLRNLFALLGAAGEAPLRATPLFVPHPRIAAVARELGCARVIACDAGDSGLIAALEAHFRG